VLSSYLWPPKHEQEMQPIITKISADTTNVHLPLSRISKQIRKQDCMISQTDSFDKTEPVGVSKSVLKTFT